MSIYWQKIQIFSWFIFFILSLSSSKVFSQEIVNSLGERYVLRKTRAGKFILNK